MKSLSQQFPGISIIGEEGDDHDADSSSEITTVTEDSVLSKQCPPELVDVTEEQVFRVIFNKFQLHWL